MTAVLGYRDWHDASACIVVDGKVVAAAPEERFTRNKHHSGFPERAIAFVLERAGLTLDQVDVVAYPRRLSVGPLLRNIPSYLRSPGYFWRKLRAHRAVSRSLTERDARTLQKRYLYTNHHFAHGMCAYLTSGWRRANIVTADALGDRMTSRVMRGENGRVQTLDYTPPGHSLGNFYSLATEACGFEVGDGEYKLMGMAPYGTPSEECRREMEATGYVPEVRGLRLWQRRLMDRNVTHFERVARGREFAHFGEPGAQFRLLVDAYGEKAVAATTQAILEERLLTLMNNVRDETGVRQSCVGGGVFLNVKANLVLREAGHELFPFPDPGDEGLCVGAALHAYHELAGKGPADRIRDVYWGPEYSEDQILDAARKSGLRHERHGDIAGTVAEMLARGKIVGWFQGRMEFGPRALGNRSILADPRDPKMKDVVNERIKHREPFRPFCPSLRTEAKGEYLKDGVDSPFMIQAFRVPPEKAKEIQAVVHVDGTCRPQTVERDVNPLFYRLIGAFEDVTSVPVVLNTSFNLAGEPIVCTPEDALRTFRNTDMDAVALGPYLVTR
ncbi:MAG: carbamoyltransferase C-terminal domain-containing protein [Halobacteria archaeon]